MLLEFFFNLVMVLKVLFIKLFLVLIFCISIVLVLILSLSMFSKFFDVKVEYGLFFCVIFLLIIFLQKFVVFEIFIWKQICFIICLLCLFIFLFVWKMCKIYFVFFGVCEIEIIDSIDKLFEKLFEEKKLFFFVSFVFVQQKCKFFIVFCFMIFVRVVILNI